MVLTVKHFHSVIILSKSKAVLAKIFKIKQFKQILGGCKKRRAAIAVKKVIIGIIFHLGHTFIVIIISKHILLQKNKIKCWTLGELLL